MRLTVLTLVLGIFAASPFVSAQGTPPGMVPPGVPGDPGVPGVDCTSFEGSLEITSETADAIEGTVSGDVEGSWSATVTDTAEHGGGVVTVVSFDAVLSTLDGDILTSGQLTRISLDPMGLASITFVRQSITGGTGAYEEAFGYIGVVDIDLPSISFSMLRGIVCTPGETNGGK